MSRIPHAGLEKVVGFPLTVILVVSTQRLGFMQQGRRQPQLRHSKSFFLCVLFSVNTVTRQEVLHCFGATVMRRKGHCSWSWSAYHGKTHERQDGGLYFGINMEGRKDSSQQTSANNLQIPFSRWAMATISMHQFNPPELLY